MSLMSTWRYGFIAGVTILLGLPIGRSGRPAPTLRVNAERHHHRHTALLVWEGRPAAWAPIDAARMVHDGKDGLGAAAGYGVLFAGGLALGLLSLVYYERWMAAAVAAP